MNRLYMILILFAVSPLSYGVNAFGKTIYAGGYIITNEQDTVFGTIRIQVDKNDRFIPSKLEKKIVFVPKKGKRTTYEPGSISYFHFFYNFETVTYASVPYFNGQLFMKVVSEKGYLKMYQYYPVKAKGLSNAYDLAELAYATDFREVSFFYILKPNGEFLFLGRNTPRKKFQSFFKDDPELAEKIESRHYKYTDVYRMVREYNKYMDDSQL